MKKIKLSKRGSKNRGLYVTLVDDDDYVWLNKYDWHITKNKNFCYVKTYINGKGTLMHRLIMNATNPKNFIDHEDGNGLNNQKANIRTATYSQNGANRKGWGTSQYLGVSLEIKKRKNKNGDTVKYKYWRSKLRKDNKIVFNKQFKTEVQAALAYNNAALKYHGKFARLNIIAP